MYEHKDGIYLRKARAIDAKNLTELKEESWWGTHGTLIVNLEEQEKWLQNIPEDQLVLIAHLSDDFADKPALKDCPIGVAVYTEIDWLNRSLNISGSIYKTYRNLKYTKAAFSAGFDFAFEVLNMRRVQAEVLSSNAGAQLLEIDHLGFQVEGVRRQAVYKCGQYYDSIMLGMLREEWENCDRVKSYEGCCNLNFCHEKASKATARFQVKFPAFGTPQ